jgi:hypothetical protein
MLQIVLRKFLKTPPVLVTQILSFLTMAPIFKPDEHTKRPNLSHE